jgi:hypothetical protein
VISQIYQGAAFFSGRAGVVPATRKRGNHAKRGMAGEKIIGAQLKILLNQRFRSSAPQKGRRICSQARAGRNFTESLPLICLDNARRST